MIGISSYGAYVPAHSLGRDVIAKAWDFPSAPGGKAVAGVDEDSITMAVEASLDCINGVDPRTIDGLFFATTTSPYREKQGSSLIAAALDLRKDIVTADFTDSLKGGTTAVRAAFDAIKSGSAKNILVTASDCRLPEPETMYEYQFGDGAAAVLLGENGVAVKIGGFYSVSDEFTGPWRTADDSFVREFEVKHDMLYGYSKSISEAISGVTKKCDMDLKDFSKAIIYAPEPRTQGRVAAKIGFDRKQIQDSMFMTIGNTGTPLCLMMLVSALERAKSGDKLLLASYGDGSDAFCLEVTDENEKVRDNILGIKGHTKKMRKIESYGKYLKFRQLLERDRFSPNSSTVTYWRDRAAEIPLYGGKCTNCGLIQYPKGRICWNCKEKDSQEDIKIPRKAKIYTYTLDHLVLGDYLETPVPRVVVEFDGGCRAFFEMTDCEPNEVEIDMEVELVFRILHEGAGFHNYYWKCRPVRG